MAIAAPGWRSNRQKNRIGAGNGGLLPGRKLSSFVFEPDWRKRPWPPKAKYGPSATDGQLGLA